MDVKRILTKDKSTIKTSNIANGPSAYQPIYQQTQTSPERRGVGL